ncbi:MAG: hypothetical protein ACRDIB_13130 [Ardenticatenaceae bacterium]
MKQRAIRLSAILLLATLILPSVGPLLDHHFAERQPGHRHAASVVQPHKHSYEDDYHHHAPGYNGDAPILVNYDSSVTAVPIVFAADLIEAFALYQPTSYFNLPPAPAERARVRYIPPPVAPPRELL